MQMDVTLVLIALGLAMDSFSVAVANGLASRKFKSAEALEIAAFFGFFQAAMPVMGWYAGISLLELISEFDHWVAFALLVFIGSKMIYESARNEANSFVNSPSRKVLLTLSIATSIDALAVGLSLSFLQTQIIVPAILTGVITFSLSLFGVYIGGRFGRVLKNRVESVGGLILVAIGAKILLEHLGFL